MCIPQRPYPSCGAEKPRLARSACPPDSGDNWEHEITVEDLLDADPDTHYPVLLAAKGSCPPEDCGGPWGYANLRQILADPNHDEHQDMLEWLGLDNASEFDPAAVTTEDIDHELALTAPAAETPAGQTR